MALTKVSSGVIKADINLVANNINSSGVITATKFVGDGSELTGVAGLGQPLSNDQTNPLSNIFKQTETLTITNGQTVNVQSDAASGNLCYSPFGRIDIQTGGVFRVVDGTTLRMNVLNVFQ